MAIPKVFDLSQVALHKTKGDAWLAINGRVLDVTRFLREHPGGEEVLLEAAGKDATEEFDAIGHSKAAKELLLKYQVGILKGFEGKYSSVAKEESQSRADVMTASVIKEEEKGSSYGVIDFFVPLTIALFTLWYRWSSAVAGMAKLA